jgi:hypothetical protein
MTRDTTEFSAALLLGILGGALAALALRGRASHSPRHRRCR